MLIRTLCLLLLAVGAAQAAPQAELWERWIAHDPRSTRHIDHRAWDGFLMRYVRIGADGVHGVAYGRVTPADRQALDAYVDGLSRLPISRYGRAEQLAYWINLYNALLVRVVLEHYPIAQRARHRRVGQPGDRRAVGRQAARDRGRSGLAQRHRAPHPAADLAGSPDPLCLELRRGRLPEPAAGAVSRRTGSSTS